MTSMGDSFAGTTAGVGAGWPQARFLSTTNASAIAETSRPAMVVKLLGFGISVAVSASHFLATIHFGHVSSRSIRARKARA
jgi:hypothetical protein